MLALGTLLYGFLLIFVLMSISRNKHTDRADPGVVTALGYVLCGLSAGVALILPLLAVYDPAAAAIVISAGDGGQSAR